MGNCCSGEPTQNGKEEVNMQRDFKNGGGAAIASSNGKQRVANPLYGSKSNSQPPSKGDILRTIIKIQAFFRGVLTRRYVQQVYGFQVQASRDPNLVVYYQ